jgi:hypothetical protein
MNFFSLVRKRASLAFFLILLSSCSKPCQEWEFEETITDCSAFNSAKVSLSPTNEFRGLELELTKNAYDSRMYINVYSRQIQENPEQPGLVDFSIQINEETYENVGYLFEGGQRILMPTDATLLVINALTENKIITISVQQYSSEIIPTNFQKHLKNLNAI